MTPPLNVVDYYQRLVAPGLVRDLRFVASADGWSCFGPGEDTIQVRHHCDVDIANGFLSFEYASGDGEGTREFALFQKADGEMIIADNGRYSEQWFYNDVRGSAPRFYSYHDGAVTDITKDVMPDSATADLFASAPGKADGVDWYYRLPQSGTDITVSLNLGFADYCKERASSFSMDSSYAEPGFYMPPGCKSYDAVVRTSVTFTFDRQAGQFKLPR